MKPVTVLVVEDNAQNLYLATYLLERAGFTVLSSSDGLEGVASARENLPDIVLMDILLPGIDGCEATRRLKADPATASIPVVALTAYSMRGDQQAATDAGCDSYITKPIDPATFGETVREILEHSSRGRPPVAEATEGFEAVAEDLRPDGDEGAGEPGCIGA